ncbi:uncharacterized protein LOC143281100 [Babylonia areolata]|uniref:uncharacterized protein LOC143281100 n=1 Tax=Babylonia areolata TaxID=304850 RepID=UPI003FD14102
MADWEKDNFLEEFLCDTGQGDLEDDTGIGLGDCLSLNQIAADDADGSLSKYLSGELLEDKTDDLETASNSSRSSQNSLMIRDDETQKNQQIIVVTRPSSSLTAEKKRGNSLSKQAVAARENRLKKKKYLSGLEAMVGKLRKENVMLKQQNIEQHQQLQMLHKEVSYLKSVIANDSALSTVFTPLVKNIDSIEGVRLSSSLLTMEQTVPETRGEKLPKAGHVAGQKRSLSNCECESETASGGSDGTAVYELVPRKQACLSRSAEGDYQQDPSEQEPLVPLEINSDKSTGGTSDTNCTYPNENDGISWNAAARSETSSHKKKGFTKTDNGFATCITINTDLGPPHDTDSVLHDLQCLNPLPPRDSSSNALRSFSHEKVRRTIDHTYTKNSHKMQGEHTV